MKNPVTIADLRHRVTIETPVRTNDGAGGAIVVWTSVAEVWAAIWPTSGSEGFTLDRTEGSVSHEIWLRFRSDVKPEMRLTFGTRVFDIRASIDPQDRGHWLKCLVRERDL